MNLRKSPHAAKFPFFASIAATALVIGFTTPPASALPDGFVVTEFAGPPNISYPTGMAVGPDGAAYVSVDLNSSLDQQPNRGSIVKCVDSDGDGKADKFTTFVANFDSPRGSCFVGDTLYVVAPPFLTAFRDTDADGVADERKDLVTKMGFDLSFRGADHTSNGVRMGIDGWLYLAIGDYGMKDAVGTDGTTLTLHGGGVLRVRPDGSELEVYTRNTRNICDVAVSQYLDVFSRDNTNDGKGWNTRFHHAVALADLGYPRLYQNFKDEHLASLNDYGGGSGTGGLYIHEPGFPEPYGDGVYTCDFTTSKVYIHPMKPFEATFVTGQEVFFDVKAIDMDVDGFSRIYVNDWRGGGYKFGDPKVGMVSQITYPGLEGAKFPDLKAASMTDLVGYLASRSGVTRINAQSEILKRGEKVGADLEKLASDEAQPVYARVAAIFTLKQLDGPGSTEALVRISKGDAAREFALRALADLKSEVEGVPAEPFLAGLKDANARVRLQAVIGLARLGRAENAGEILPLGLEPSVEAPAEEAAGAGKGRVAYFLQKKKEDAHEMELDITGEKELFLAALGGHDGNGGDHADWCEPRLVGPKGELKLTELKWKSGAPGWGQLNVDKTCLGKPLTVGGKVAAYGIGTHADSVLAFDLPEGYTTFKVRVAVDDEIGGQKEGGGTVEFVISTRPPAGGTGGGEGPEHYAIPHVAVKALASLGNAKACLAVLEDTALRPVALRALQEMHSKEAVDGLIQKLLGAKSDAVRAAILPALFRLYHREAEWEPKTARDWWTTRPDDRGPYFTPVEWGESGKIKRAIEQGMAMVEDKSLQPGLVEVLAKNRIDPKAIDLGAALDPLFALLMEAAPSASHIPLLRSAAEDQAKPEAVRAQAFNALGRVPDGAGFVAQMGALGSWGNVSAGKLATLRAGFINDPNQATRVAEVLARAREGSDAESAVAWGIALNLVNSPLAAVETKAAIQSEIDGVPKQPGFYLALVESGLAGRYGAQIEGAKKWDNPEIIAAAKLAADAGAKSAAEGGKAVAEMDAGEVAKLVMAAKGEVLLGAQLFTRQGCVACHTVSEEEVPKGPYLGTAGKFPREYLIEAILDPNKVVAQGFQSNLFTMKDGAVHMGFVTDSGGDSIEVRNIAGITAKLPKADVKKQELLPTSMMPPGLAGPLTVREFASLVDYLQSLK